MPGWPGVEGSTAPSTAPPGRPSSAPPAGRGGGGGRGAPRPPPASGEPEILASCYRRSLAVADELGARSVAFPAISTGIYGYPPQLAAEVAVTTVAATTTEVEIVQLVAFDSETHAFYARLLTGRGRR